jgi:hypothetical protein
MTVKEVKPTINRDGLENSNDWETPDWLYKEIDDRFHFDYDPCPLNYTVDGLDYNIPWGEINWVNPPYDRVNKPKFIKRAYEEWRHLNKTCVLLIPPSTDTKQFHDYLFPNAKPFIWKDWLKLKQHDYNKAIVFFEGRIAFKGINTKGEYTDSNKGKYGNMLVVLKH